MIMTMETTTRFFFPSQRLPPVRIRATARMTHPASEAVPGSSSSSSRHTNIMAAPNTTVRVVGLLLVLILGVSVHVVDAFTILHSSSASPPPVVRWRHQQQLNNKNNAGSIVSRCPSTVSLLPSPSSSSSSSTTTTTAVAAASIASSDSSNEFEYVEYDLLKEEDFVASEWLVGTNWDSDSDRIGETWVRLAVDKENKGQNVAIWGDGKQGKWSLDGASQFLTVSKEGILGKQIWACTTDDYYYLQGTVRGWNYFKVASVLGQWQARRLGVDPEEAGTAPWFENNDENDEKDATTNANAKE